jgi:hypothetical protein
MKMAKRRSGWFGESERHSLASKGIKTGNKPKARKVPRSRSKPGYKMKWIRGEATPRSERKDKAFELGFQAGDYQGVATDLWLIELIGETDDGSHEYIFEDMEKLISQDPSQERELWEYLAFGWQAGMRHYGPSLIQLSDNGIPTEIPDKAKKDLYDDVKYHAFRSYHEFIDHAMIEYREWIEAGKVGF